MSEGAGGAVPANIFISTNDESFKEFLKNALEGMKELDKQGKKTFKSLGDQAKDFVKTALGGALLGAGKDFAEVVAEPFNTTFKGATDAARDFRRENTRLSVAVGQDWQKVGAELDQLAVKTRRAPEQIRAYAEQVKDVTGNWKTATAGVETYSKLATYLGKKGVEDLAPFAAEMENTFGLAGEQQAASFFNTLINRAEALGLKGQQAVAIFQRLGPALGKEAAKGPEGVRQAGQDAKMINALMTMGATPEETQAIMGKVSSVFSGDLQWMERHMKAWGVIDPKTGKPMGKGAHLRGKFGRLNYSHFELLKMLRETEKKRTGNNKGRLHQRLRQDQNLGEVTGDLVANNWDEFEATVAAQDFADPNAKPLDVARKIGEETPEGVRQFEEILRKQRDRKEVGEPTLGAQDEASHLAPGGKPGIAQNYGIKGIGIAGAVRASEALLARLGLGRLAAGAGRFNPLLAMGSVAMMSGDSSVEAPKNQADYYARMTPEQRTVALTAQLEGIRKSGGRDAYGGYEDAIVAANPQVTKAQADATAKALKEGAPVPVVIRSFALMPAPLPGGGAQDG